MFSRLPLANCEWLPRRAWRALGIHRVGLADRESADRVGVFVQTAVGRDIVVEDREYAIRARSEGNGGGTEIIVGEVLVIEKDPSEIEGEKLSTPLPFAQL